MLVDDDTGEPAVDLSKLGRFNVGGGELVERELNTGAFGDNKFTTLATPGVLQLDLLQVMRREHKLAAYRYYDGCRIRRARHTPVASAPTNTATSPMVGGGGGPVRNRRTSRSRCRRPSLPPILTAQPERRL